MKNTLVKKLLVTALAAVMVTGLLAGCGKDADESSESSVVESTGSVVEESSESIESTESTAAEESSEEESSTVEESGAEVTDASPSVAIAQEIRAELANSQDLETVVGNVLANSKVIPGEMMLGSMPVEEGYLNGFDDEIHGFTTGMQFGPMIGTIPFIGYVFETEDAQALADTLDSHAMLNWNICTSADEKHCEIIDDKYVVFVMTPASFNN